MLPGFRRYSFIRRSALPCAASARTRCACRRSAPPSRAHPAQGVHHRRDLAGVAGALLARLPRPFRWKCSLRALGRRAGDLILGGAGRLYGGAARRHRSTWWRATSSPASTLQYWYFWIGLLLVAVVMSCPTASSGVSQDSFHQKTEQGLRLAGGGRRTSTSSCRGRALRAHRPQWRGKDTLINLLTGMLRAPAIALDAADITSLRPMPA